jgi:hypothetical protein
MGKHSKRNREKRKRALRGSLCEKVLRVVEIYIPNALDITELHANEEGNLKALELIKKYRAYKKV